MGSSNPDKEFLCVNSNKKLLTFQWFFGNFIDKLQAKKMLNYLLF